MKNKLVVIGYLGSKTVYLNVSREDAIQRFRQNDGCDVVYVEEFEFDDSFGAYDVWKQED